MYSLESRAMRERASLKKIRFRLIFDCETGPDRPKIAGIPVRTGSNRNSGRLLRPPTPLSASGPLPHLDPETHDGSIRFYYEQLRGIELLNITWRGGWGAEEGSLYQN